MLQVDTSAKWADTLTVFNNRHYFAPELIDIYNNAFMPSLQATSLQVYDKKVSTVWTNIFVLLFVLNKW